MMLKFVRVCLVFIFALCLGRAVQVVGEESDYSAGIDFEKLAGKEITFGIHKHVTSTSSELDKKPITWLVMDNDMHLISKYLVDKQVFHASSNVWSSSSLCTWLNGTFMNAFESIDPIREVEVDMGTVKSKSKVYVPHTTDGTINGMTYLPDNTTSSFNLVTTCRDGSKPATTYYWTRTPVSGKTNQAYAVRYVSSTESLSAYAVNATNSFVRSCITLDKSKIIFVDGIKPTFVVGDVGTLSGIPSSAECNVDDDLTLSNILASKTDKNYTINYKIVADNEILSSGGFSSSDSKITLATSKLQTGNYDVYVWLQKCNDDCNYAATPKQFKLTVTDAKPEIKSVTISPIAHVVGSEQNAIVKIVADNTKPDDVFQIAIDSENLTQSSQKEITISKSDLAKLNLGEHIVKVNLLRKGESVSEFSCKYYVSDKPVIKDIVVTQNALLLDELPMPVDVGISISGIELGDTVKSCSVRITNEITEETVASTNEFTFAQDVCRTSLTLPCGISPAQYRIHASIVVINNHGIESELNADKLALNVSQRKLNAPTITPKGRNFSSNQSVSVIANDLSDVYYSVNNGPFTLYSQPIKLHEGRTILKAVAGKTNCLDSDIVTETFVVDSPSNSNTDSIFESSIQNEPAVQNFNEAKVNTESEMIFKNQFGKVTINKTLLEQFKNKDIEIKLTDHSVNLFVDNEKYNGEELFDVTLNYVADNKTNPLQLYVYDAVNKKPITSFYHDHEMKFKTSGIDNFIVVLKVS